MPKIPDSVYSSFLSALLDGNRKLCSQIIREQVNLNVQIKDLYEQIMKKALYRIGELWEFNKISVATEHLASAIVEAILNELYSIIALNQKSQKKIIVACVENELHQIGVKMVADLFELNGWDAYFLGANTPTEDLISFAKTKKPDVFAFSLSLYFHLPKLETMITMIRAEFPDIPILVGGQAFSRGGKDVIEKYANVTYLYDLESIDTYIKHNYDG
jgi:methanogenic corrinoid protein MtbC1